MSMHAELRLMPVVSIVCLVYKRASGKTTRHQALNDVIARLSSRLHNIRQQKTGWFNSFALVRG